MKGPLSLPECYAGKRSCFWFYVSSCLSSSPLTLSFLWRTYQTNVFMSMCHWGKHHTAKRNLVSEPHIVSCDWIMYTHTLIDLYTISNFVDSSFLCSFFLCFCSIFILHAHALLIPLSFFLFFWFSSLFSLFVYTCMKCMRHIFKSEMSKLFLGSNSLCGRLFKLSNKAVNHMF